MQSTAFAVANKHSCHTAMAQSALQFCISKNKIALTFGAGSAHWRLVTHVFG